jgi:autotransporter passenger strand-loop-strand repeat protein
VEVALNGGVANDTIAFGTGQQIVASGGMTIAAGVEGSGAQEIVLSGGVATSALVGSG